MPDPCKTTTTPLARSWDGVPGPQDLLIDYASSKGGVLALTRALAHKLAPRGICVNAVAAGPICTPLIPASFPPEKVERFGKHAPFGGPACPARWPPPSCSSPARTAAT